MSYFPWQLALSEAPYSTTLWSYSRESYPRCVTLEFNLAVVWAVLSIENRSAQYPRIDKFGWETTPYGYDFPLFSL